MITLYHCPEARSMRSLWLLHELDVDFHLVEMPFDLAVLRASDYLSVHPLGRVPCLVDGSRTLFESGAICQYLCETCDDRGLGRPPGHPERAEWLQWLHYAETVAVHGAALVQQSLIRPPEARSPVVQKLEKRRLEKSLEVLDRHLSARDYLLESGFSACDTAVGYSVRMGARHTPLDAVPHVAAYYARLRERPAFKASLPGAQPPTGARSRLRRACS